jgi:hypothetical protein
VVKWLTQLFAEQILGGSSPPRASNFERVKNMSQKEQQPGREKWGKRALYGGVVAGIIGLILWPELAVAGFAVAAGGLIIENTGKK